MRLPIYSSLLSAAALILTCAIPADACVNDSYTVIDESQMDPEVFELITGQFPHHGDAFYEARVRRYTEAPPSDGQLLDLNDLGVAYLKLKQYDKALEVFSNIEASYPNQYKTHANLGVLYKKIGQYEKAAHHIAQSLKIKPAGHLGLGDYYLQMLSWKAAALGQNPMTPRANFLGISYRTPSVAVLRADFDRIKALIRADRHFSDAFVVLGDILKAQGKTMLARWAWVRALQLDHPNQEMVKSRLDSVVRSYPHLREDAEMDRYDDYENEKGRNVSYGDFVVHDIQGQIKTAGVWLATFEQVEGELIAAGNQAVTFADVSQELTRRGVDRMEQPEATKWVRSSMSRAYPFIIFGMPIVAAILGVLALKLMVRSTRWLTARLRGAASATPPAPARA